MSRYYLPLGVFAALVVLLGFAIVQAPRKDLVPSPLIGKLAPSFDLPSLAHPARRVSSVQLEGHWYLFNVWGTWCYACRDEQPMLLTIRKSGLVPVIGLDWNDSRAEALAYLRKMGNPYERVAVDRNGSEAILWGVYAAPESFLVNPAGIIVYKCIGVITPRVWQKQILPRLLTGKAETVTS